MKRLKLLLVLLISFVMFTYQNVNAASGSLIVSTGQVYVGDSFNVSVVVSSTAAWNIHVNASGPVSGCSINQADSTADAMNTNRTFNATCTATGTGTITISLTGDVTDANDGLPVSVGGTKTVNVINRPAPPPSNPTPSNPTPSPSGPADNRSTNTSLKKLTVNGETLTNSNNVFTMEVSNYVEKVDIEAVVSDSKSKVSGTGSKSLKVGENSFNLVVTAEKGNTTTYTVKVIRKEYNTLSDFDELLKLSKDVEIKITEKAKLTKEQIDKIIQNKKKIILTKFDEKTKNILYSFILDGNTIKSSGEFNPNITAVVEELADMEAAFNYAAGIYLDFSNCGDLPKGIVLKYFVGDKYKDSDKVNLYSYDSSKVTQLKENIPVVDGYIEFNVDESLKHLISKAKVLNAEKKSDEINIWFYVSMGLIAVIVIGGLAVFMSKNKKKKETVSVEKKSTDAPVITEVVEKVPEVPVVTQAPVATPTTEVVGNSAVTNQNENTEVL